MKTKVIILSTLAGLAGCNTLPRMPDAQPESINKLADIVECEILTVFKENKSQGGFDFSNWTSTYAITQNVTANDDANVDPLKWIAPAGVDKLLYSANASASREAYRNGKVEYSVFVLEKRSKACARKDTYKDIHVDVKDFRLRDWVSQVSHHTERQMNSFSYSVRVTVTTGAGVGADFADGKWIATGGISHARTTIETIDFTFSELPKTPKPTRVIVVAPIPESHTLPPGKELQGTSPYILKSPNILNLPSKNDAGKSTPVGPRRVPESAVDRNRGIMQLQQLDRITPDFLNN
ncbi:hypothetical protein [Rhizobium multihospitium]|uniref:Lipoprotein n=1 Tax=Rhizobium multihospitium TaxID=410764 RepID=A0A1C3UAK6_9HYPH|nr:hypothetical protein [Rhizobium multihospitium]SCB12510.1 hypothetical protein GA0061103_1816 [Rhizobium multihospitium]